MGSHNRVQIKLNSGPESGSRLLAVDCTAETTAAAVRCILRLAERDPSLVARSGLRSILFSVIERRGRAGGMLAGPVQAIAIKGSSGVGLSALRFAVSKQAEHSRGDEGSGRGGGSGAEIEHKMLSIEQSLVLHSLNEMVRLISDALVDDDKTAQLYCEWFSFCR